VHELSIAVAIVTKTEFQLGIVTKRLSGSIVHSTRYRAAAIQGRYRSTHNFDVLNNRIGELVKQHFFIGPHERNPVNHGEKSIVAVITRYAPDRNKWKFFTIAFAAADEYTRHTAKFIGTVDESFLLQIFHVLH